MPKALAILLDQNVPTVTTQWLRQMKPSWTVHHTNEAGLLGKSDNEVFDWAQNHQAIIITYDEDFADRRLFSAKDHAGIVRLRVWPTTIEETQNALERLLAEIDDEELSGALVIIDRIQIRVRSPKKSDKSNI